MSRTHRSPRHTRSALGLAALALFPLACTRGQPAKEAEPEPEPHGPVTLDLWAGVPPLELQTGDVAIELAPKEGPAPPPSVSERVDLPFPVPAPPSGPPKVAAPGPLKVLRHGPVGDQQLVDAVSVVFDQPMIPLASVADLRQEHVPVTITPQPPGKFRWLGTEALTFEAEGRFPYSTTYTVEVAAGERSTLGGQLSKPLRWTFTTPALEVETSSPYLGSTNVLLDTPIVVRFNQAVRVDALAAAGLTLSGGGHKIPLRVVPKAEWSALPADTRWLTGQPFDDRLLVLRADQKLTPNTTYTLKIPAGAHGEGPNPGKGATLSFSTYPPLTLSGPTCDAWSCTPSSGLFINASTSLAAAELEGKVHVTPEVPGLKIAASGGIYLTGEFVGDETYTITVDAGIKDIHGQELARPYTTRVTMKPLEPTLSLAVGYRDPAVIETSAAHRLLLAVGGLDTLEVRGRAFGLDALSDILNNRWFDSSRTWPEGLAAPTHTKSVSVGDSRRRLLRHGVDLEPMLERGKVLLLALRSNEFRRWGYSDRFTMTQLVEVTDLGISAALDHAGGVVMVTSIERGEPLAGVELEIRRSWGNEVLWRGRTDAGGLATVALAGSPDGQLLVTARLGDDAAYMPLSQEVAGRWWAAYAHRDTEPRVFIYNDRQPYKPGETIHVAGVLRQEEHGPKGSVAFWRRDFKAKYTLTGPRGHEVAKGEAQVGPLGTFAVDLQLEENADLGDYTFMLEAPGGWFTSSENFYHSINVSAYRAPEFEVEVEREEAAPLCFGDTLRADVHGSYLHGAPLVGGQVTYTLRRQETSFSPAGPENEGFTFGRGWAGPWYYRDFAMGLGAELLVAQGAGALDAAGIWHIDHVLAAIEKNLADPSAAAPAADKDPPKTASYTLEAQVTDQNRQAIAGRSTYVVHPALHYAGVRADRTVYRAGEQAKVEAVVVDVDGKRVAGRPIAIELVREETRRKAVEKDGAWTYEYTTDKVSAGACSPTSADAPVSCDLRLEHAGSYTLRALVEDPQGRKNLTTSTIYVHGKDAVVWDQDQRRVDLVPDKRSYEPGEKATLLVRSPFDRARGLLVVERDGIVEHRPIAVEGGSAAVEVTIPETAVPNLHVSVLLLRGRVDVPGAPPGQDLGRPAQAAGVVELQVSSARKKIGVELTPDRAELAPKDTLRLKVQTRDHEGKGRPAAVALMVVDEGVLSLLGYPTPDPLAFFHHPRSGGTGLFDLRSFLLAREDAPPPMPQPVPEESAASMAAPAAEPAPTPMAPGGLGLVGTGRGGGGVGDDMADSSGGSGQRHKGEEGKMGKPTSKSSNLYAMRGPRAESKKSAAPLDANAAMANPISLRSLFATTAYWNPEVRTDANGEATVEIPMPENLTSFRVMAVAVDPEAADRFGSADTSVKVRKPIMLRPSLPRFANYGDKFEASVMVDNQTKSPQAILVGTRALGVSLTGDTQRTVEIPAGESREVRFPMAVEQVGRLRLQFAALANEGRDATEVTIPVNLPVAREAFADYGVTDGSIARLIKAPMDALPGYGGLELSLASTALTGLEDAARYLVTYDYECSEQTASRLLPIFVLGPIFDAFKIDGAADQGSRDALAKAGIARLLGRQNWDGGFRFWDTPARSWPYLTTWVTFALLEGKRAGAAVDQAALDRALDYLSTYVQSGEETEWGRYYDWTSQAFALWLLSREGRGAEHFDRVWARRGKIPLYGDALLMSAAHRYGRRREAAIVRGDLLARATENARVAHIIEGKSEDLADGLRLLMHSDVQTDAVALMALLEVDPENPLLPKLMAGVMAERDPRLGGRWSTTHANAWSLLAANRYFTTVEKEVPDYVARIWLDQGFAGQQEFRGRSMTVTEHTVPMKRLQAAPEQTLTLAKEGPGKLYYRLGLRYAPASLEVAPEAQGFVVYRTYEAVGQGADKPAEGAVRQLDGGAWEIKAGTLVKVNLTLVARDRATFVVVDDPLPAGLEGQNSRFQTTLQDVGANLGPGYGGEYGLGGVIGKMVGPSRWYSDWWWPWWSWDHTELRDDRLLLFADRLPAGVYTYSYLARATTIGEFKLPPIHAEGMYTPEQFGHSASGTVRVVE